MKLSTRLTIAMVTLVVLAATAVGVLTYRNVGAVVLPRALERLALETDLLAGRMAADVGGVRADVVGFRASIGLNKVMLASLAAEQAADGVTLTSWRSQLASRFAAELAAKPNYDQFRVIGIADGGREIVRVDRSRLDGTVRIVPDAELQAKGDRGYFQQAIRLPDGEIYISPVELNQENGIIETPHVPMLRAATPIYAPDGRPFGIVIINVDLRQAFAGVRSSSRESADLFVRQRAR